MIRDAQTDDAVEIAALLKPYVDKKILLHRSLEEIRENAPQTVVFVEAGRILGSSSLVFFSPTLCEIRALVITEAGTEVGGEEFVAGQHWGDLLLNLWLWVTLVGCVLPDG